MEDENPIWADILDAIYFGGLDGRYLTTLTEGEEPKPSDLDGELPADSDFWKLNSEAQKRIIDEMKTAGLIEIREVPDSSWKSIRLTERGFDVAHKRQTEKDKIERERERHKRQYKVNRILATLTLGLVFTGVIQAATALLDSVNATQGPYAALSLATILVMGLIGREVHRQGFWEEDDIEL
ncbi:hypothetical protein [Haloferax sp. Atlit-6N]|uniref:hypothetical protein n=1 Tax=Haloferax sp. Atlit-6N TaxID=2077205 RepID=UPI0011C02ED1|nr:hypothetical protein [Haloferax sp. Atlit-6N]